MRRDRRTFTPKTPHSVSTQFKCQKIFLLEAALKLETPDIQGFTRICFNSCRTIFINLIFSNSECTQSQSDEAGVHIAHDFCFFEVKLRSVNFAPNPPIITVFEGNVCFLDSPHVATCHIHIIVQSCHFLLRTSLEIPGVVMQCWIRPKSFSRFRAYQNDCGWSLGTLACDHLFGYIGF